MSMNYRSLDRSTHMTIFCASLLIVATLMGSVTSAFAAPSPHSETNGSQTTIVVQV